MRANENYFRHVDNETYRAIGELLQSKKILEVEVNKENMEGGQDMCKALEDMCQHAVERKLREQVEKKVKKGCSVAEIADMLEEDMAVIDKIVNEIE